ncbi:DUF397 domain-containing protein [Actinokineospora xionganensis]|uniref:DUF397 domain-containing protein n=1 Tax=Actinokineospora xionganensis TaxID=2684470 RepID=A0ABR7L6H6_9PSEU|nr:DUF397 domain-containing protein [Actinokineospora xionganensis]MBC6448275.1 DUF397 domain-containing protein [Actinokineospora xionganensis]
MITYRKSSFCSTGNCVEIAVLADGDVALRDSKDSSLPPHVFTPQEWIAFTEGVKHGEFDYPAVANSR